MTLGVINTLLICVYLLVQMFHRHVLSSKAQQISSIFSLYFQMPCCESHLAHLWLNQQAPFLLCTFDQIIRTRDRWNKALLPVSDASLSLVVSECQSQYVNKSCFFHLWSNPDTSVVRSVRGGWLWAETGVLEVPLSFNNGLGKDEGNVDRDNSTIVKASRRQMWENTKFKQNISNESMLTHGVKFIRLHITGKAGFQINFH